MLNDVCFDQFPELESDRLQFRSFRKSDVTGLHSIRSNGKVMEFMDSTPHQTLADSEQFIQGSEANYNLRSALCWAIVDKASHKLIGDFSFWKIDRNHHRGEIGYVLDPDYWGQGFMRETMFSLIDFGFKKLNLHSMEANINPKNDSSRKILLRVGFKKEAYFRESYYFDGQYMDSEIYSLLESDFNPTCRFNSEMLTSK